MMNNTNENKQKNSTTLTEPGVREESVTQNQLIMPGELFEMTPKIVNDFMRFGTPLSDTPNEFLLLPFLTIIGALIGRKRYINAGGIKILPITWTVLFAGSSSMRKSTAISIAKKPFKDVEKVFRDNYEQDMKQWKKQKKQSEDKDEEFDVPQPKLKTLFAPDGFSDLTFWESLRDNKSIVSIASEFTGLWTELNKTYNGLSDLALKLFDGEGGRRVTKSGGDIRLTEPVWCIVGATTLDNFRQSLSTTQRGSGFLQRIIPICMEENPKPFRSILENSREDIELRQTISEYLISLLSLESTEVKLDENATKKYKKWSYNLHEESLGLENRISDIGGYYSRLSIYALKFALIFKVLESHEGNITGRNMEASIILCEWIKNHILYMLENNYIFDQSYADRVKVRDIIKKQPGNVITRTKLMNHSHFTAKRLDSALNSEFEAGTIGWKKEETEGRDRTVYYLK